MDKEPLVVDASMDIDTLTRRTVEYGEKALSDGFIITREGAFAGVGNGLQLMRVSRTCRRRATGRSCTASSTPA